MADKIVDYKALGKRIQHRRQQLGLSQSTAAEKLDLSVSFYSRVERGEKSVSLETLIKISTCFQSSLDYLFQDSMKLDSAKKLQVELIQIFSDKTPEQTKQLMEWLKVLSENISRL